MTPNFQTPFCTCVSPSRNVLYRSVKFPAGVGEETNLSKYVGEREGERGRERGREGEREGERERGREGEGGSEGRRN